MAIQGRYGILFENCTIWKTEKSWKRTHPSFSRLACYARRCCNCNYKTTLLRLNGGVVALEKVKLIDGVRIPVAHDNAAYKAFLSSTQSSLSHGQKIFMAKECARSGNWDDYVCRLANHHEYPPSDAQLQDLKNPSTVFTILCVAIQCSVNDTNLVFWTSPPPWKP